MGLLTNKDEFKCKTCYSKTENWHRSWCESKDVNHLKREIASTIEYKKWNYRNVEYARKEEQRWKAKFREVKHENNKLRAANEKLKKNLEEAIRGGDEAAYLNMRQDL